MYTCHVDTLKKGRETYQLFGFFQFKGLFKVGSLCEQALLLFRYSVNLQHAAAPMQ